MLDLMHKVPPELFDTLSEEELRVMARQPEPATWPANLQVKVSEYMSLEPADEAAADEGPEVIQF